MKKIIAVLSIICFLFVSEAKASHIAGGDLSYVCLGGNQYQINLNLFVDCLGFDPGNIQTVSFTSTCGGTATASVNCTNPGGTEISQLCPTQLNNSTCNGGSLPGMWVFHYTGVVTLSPPCDTWTMSWTVCCRNAAILNLVNPSSFGSYIQATLNSSTAPCNTSPAFTAQPIPYVCSGQLVNYNYGVIETDGDSLYYSLIGAMDAGATALAYSGGYSATSPIPGITIDPVTGTLTFTPTTLGNFVVVVLVQEYDSNGNLIGTVMRDIQFIVQTCSNNVPDPTAGAITGMTGTAVQTGPFSIELCEGSNFTFNATYTDVNATDSLSFITNILSVLPGATITYSGSNPAVATISWTAPAGSANTNTTFSITVDDGACPVPGQQTFVYDIQVQPRTLAGPDHIICGPQTATLAGTGGNTFTWTAISGPAIVVGTNFSCNPCANPVASPSVTTTYEVTSDLSGTCVNKDTVTITVVPDYSFTVTQSTTSSCLLQPIQLNATPTPGGTYTYDWSPSTYLSSDTIANPVANIGAPGTYSYVLALTSPLGCVKLDTVSITVTPSYPPNTLVTASDTSVCVGDTVSLAAYFGSSIPAVCGPSSSGGCASTMPITVGTGTLSSNAYPTPFTGFWEDGRIQILYTAAELNAMGFVGGKIPSLAIDVATKASTQPYSNFRIKMGCTSLSAFATTFQNIPTTVYGPVTYTPTLGLNTFNLTTVYEWDGISNLIVEMCYDNASWTGNDILNKTATTTTMTLLQYSDASVGCNFTAPTGYLERPNIIFDYCGGAADSSNFTYSWFPTTGSGSVFVNNTQLTGAQLPGNTQYSVVVTDTVSGCVDTAFINIAAGVTTLSVNAGADTVVCPGAPAQLHATGATDFVWSPPAALSNNLIANPVSTSMTTITYTVVGTSQCAAGSAMDSVTVSIQNLLSITVDAGPNDTICPGVPVSLNATGATGYSWSPSTALSNPNISNPVASPSVTTTYVVTGSAYCADTVQDSVMVFVPVVAPYTSDAGSEQTICLGESFTLSASANGGYGNDMYMWSLVSPIGGDSITNPFLSTINVNPTQPGDNIYVITVVDRCGYMTNDSVTIHILQDCQLIIPNIFTPNGDGKNDAFKVSGNGISTFSIQIYNRWGQKEFESQDINDSWNGSGAHDGTFYYIIHAESINGTTFEKTGFLQMLSN